MNKQAYLAGFKDMCTKNGVNPDSMLKLAQDPGMFSKGWESIKGLGSKIGAGAKAGYGKGMGGEYGKAIEWALKNKKLSIPALVALTGGAGYGGYKGLDAMLGSDPAPVAPQVDPSAMEALMPYIQQYGAGALGGGLVGGGLGALAGGSPLAAGLGAVGGGLAGAGLSQYLG